jgi:DNA-binding GntR family transcriptional regulator
LRILADGADNVSSVPTGLQPLRIETVVDRVYDEVRRRIVEGELGRGTKLRQEALADALGVSRTPLREALRRLAAEGLVEFHPNRGATVATLTAEDVRSAYEARLAFEPGAARLAAVRRAPDHLAGLRAAIADQRSSPGTREAYAASRAFHLALVQASGNEYLVRLAEALWVPGLAQAIYELQAAQLSGRLDADLAEHERIADAIESGDPDLAETLVRAHIQAALSGLLGS